MPPTYLLVLFIATGPSTLHWGNWICVYFPVGYCVIMLTVFPFEPIGFHLAPKQMDYSRRELLPFSLEMGGRLVPRDAVWGRHFRRGEGAGDCTLPPKLGQSILLHSYVLSSLKFVMILLRVTEANNVPVSSHI